MLEPIHPRHLPNDEAIVSRQVHAERQARAILLGGAVGDAVGWPVEFLLRDEITSTYGKRGIAAPPDPALTTDDTEMTIALTRALIAAGEKPIEGIMEAMTHEFVRWLETHNPRRAPGSTCLSGARALAQGVSWRDSGVPDGAGCGAAMRVAPIGFLYQHDEARLIEVAAASARATHGAKSAILAAAGMALAVKYALDGYPAVEISDRVVSAVATGCPRFDQAIDRFVAARAMKPDYRAIESIGGGWDGDEALLMSLLCVERAPDSFQRAVQLGANISGDSDSVASMVGSIQAARLGLAAIPPRWLKNLEGQPELEALATALAEKKMLVTEPPP